MIRAMIGEASGCDWLGATVPRARLSWRRCGLRVETLRQVGIVAEGFFVKGDRLPGLFVVDVA